MKKFIILIIVSIVIITLLFSGCSFEFQKYPEDFNQSSKTEYVIESDTDTIMAKKGDKFTIYLESNASTGFSWEIDINDEKILRIVDTDYKSDNNNTGDASSIPIGSGGTKAFTFEVLDKGETKLILNYAQHWDGGLDGETLTYSVIVE